MKCSPAGSNWANGYKLNFMKRCNCHPPKPIPGPIQYTGSSLYPDVGPRPFPPYPPMPPCPPVPVPEPWPVCSVNKTVIVDGVGDVTVTRADGVYDTTYTVSLAKRYEVQPFSQEELTELFDSVDNGGI